MKKFVTRTLILSVLMIAMLAMSAFGAFAAGLGDQGAPVKGTYEAADPSATVYAVTVSFGSMEFTYVDANEGTWDPATQQYTDAATAAWTCAEGANVVTVTNQSNAAVAVTVAYAAAADYQAVTGAVANNSFTLPTAEGKAVGAADLTAAATLTLTGAITAGEAVTLGNLTVTIAAAAQ